MSRDTVPPGLDKHVFQTSAARVKAINISSRVYRGGIRL